MTLTTTLALLRKHNACPSGYRMLAKHLGGVESYGMEYLRQAERLIRGVVATI